MKVVLTQDVDAGDKWDVLDVADGYARNYLFPLNMAIKATTNNLKTVENLKQQQSKKIEKQKKEIEELKAKLEKMDAITIFVKAGENGKLFGSVTHKDIIEKVKEVSGVELEKKRLQTRSLKEAGKYEINIKLPFGVSSSIVVIVEADVSESSEEVVDMRDILHKKRRRPRRDQYEDNYEDTSEVVDKLEKTEANADAVVEKEEETTEKVAEVKAEENAEPKADELPVENEEATAK